MRSRKLLLHLHQLRGGRRLFAPADPLPLAHSAGQTPAIVPRCLRTRFHHAHVAAQTTLGALRLARETDQMYSAILELSPRAFALQIHVGPAMRVQFKGLYVKRL